MSDEAYQSDLQYLEDELNWIEMRCKRIITQQLVRDLSADDDAGVYYNQSYYGGQNQSLEQLRARAESLEKQERKQRLRIDSRLSVNRDRAKPVAVDQLVELYDLSPFERTVLLLAASITFSRKFLQLYGRIWNGYEALVVETVFSFCELSFAERITHLKKFSKQETLFRNELVTLNLGARINSPQELLDAQLRISNRTFDFIVGDEHFMDDFMEFSSVEEPRARFEQVVLDARDKERIRSVIERHEHYLECRREWGFDEIISYGRGILMLFHGKPGTGKTMMAHAVAHEMDMRVLNVDIPTFINHYDAQRFLPGLFREARMQNAILFFDECEALFATRTHGNPLMTLLLTEIERFEGVAILATNLPQQLDDALDRRILVRVGFPEPDRPSRRTIWEKHLPEKAPLADDIDCDALAEQFEMTGGYIKNAVLMAVADAVHRGGDSPTITMEALERAAREQTTPANEEESPVVIPRTSLEHVALEDSARDVVDELVDAARSRKTVLDRWSLGRQFSYGHGLAALFWGPAGTGKTMCAEAVSNALNRPMRLVSASGYGDSLNALRAELERAFDDCRSHNAVLVLDGADVLWSEDHDFGRWFGSILDWQPGVVLAVSESAPEPTTGISDRFQFVVPFEMPDADRLARIWRGLLDGAEGADELDYDELGQRWKLSGADARKVAFRAAFRAARGGSPISTGLIEEVVGESSGELGFDA